MSTTTHPGRFSLLQRLEVESIDAAGLASGQLTGFALDPNLLIGLAALAVDRSCRMLAGWNAVDAADLHDAALFTLQACGIGS